MSERHSPLHELLTPLAPEWKVIQGMPAPMRLAGDDNAAAIRLSDASCLQRMGVKGAGAENWLRQQGVDTLPGVNGWLRTPAGLLVARLARSEFFVEETVPDHAVARLRERLAPASGVTPVLRQDAALVLGGPRVNDLLTQVCNVDFLGWQSDERVAVMTTLVGVSALIIWEPFEDGRRYRLWCDPTFAPYLWQTLLEISQELGGGAAGLGTLLPELSAP